MELLHFEPSLTAAWDAFVAGHPLAGYGHLSANFALTQHGGFENASMMVRDGKKIVAVLPLFEHAERVLRAIRVRELISGALFPAGPLISPQTKGKAEAAALALLLEGLEHRSRARRIDRIRIAYPNITAGQPTAIRLGYSPLLHHGFHACPGVGLLLDLAQPLERLAAGRSSGCRQTINKGEAGGIRTAVIQERDEWLSCHALNLHTLGPLALSEAEVAAIWDHFIVPGHASARGTYVGGSLRGVTVTIQVNGAVYYWHGWRTAAAVNGEAHVGLWHAIVAAREQGCQIFELGSLEFANARNIGISQFKRSFGGVPFQTLAAHREVKAVKAAAIALAETAVAALRARRGVTAPSPASVKPAASRDLERSPAPERAAPPPALAAVAKH
jgi:hypothetical protein